MASLLILGAGQYGLVAKEIAECQGYEPVSFLDDRSELAVGKLEELPSTCYDSYFVAIGDPSVRRHWVEEIQAEGKKLATLIHPSAIQMPSSCVAEGSVLEAGAVICSGARVGKACIVMANAVVGHHASVGSFCQLKYHSTVAERAVVCEGSVVPCNTTILESAPVNRQQKKGSRLL